LANELPGSEADNCREGWIGELQVRELFYAHAGTHGGRDELDHLHGLLSYYVRTQDASRGAGHDEFAGAVGVSRDDPAVQVGIGYDRDGTIVAELVASLALREADAAVFWIGETAVRDESRPPDRPYYGDLKHRSSSLRSARVFPAA
jgi:hypothetical protein